MLSYLASSYRDAFRGLSRQTWYLSFVMFVNRSGTMVIPFMTIYLTRHLGISMGKAGWVMALFGLGSVAGALIGGRLTDRIGFYPVQLCALAGGGIMFIVLGQGHSFPLICVCTFLLSVVNESFRPANQTAIAWFSSPQNRTRSYSLNRLAINLGWAGGGALGGFLAEKNYELLFWVDGCTNILAATLLFLLIPVTKTTLKPDDLLLKQKTKGTAYRDKPFIAFAIFLALFAICFFQSFATLPVFYREQWNLTETTIGIILAYNGLMIFLVEMPFIKLAEGRTRALNFVIAGVTITGISYVMLNILPASVTAAFISMTLFTIGEITAMPFMNAFWTGRSNSANRGEYAAVYTLSFSVAQVTGFYSGSQAADHLGFDTLWWIVGLLCVAAALGFRYVRQKTAHE